jgi:hypothetical protein
MLGLRLLCTAGCAVRALLRPQRELRVVLGSTVLVVLTVRVLALRPLRRVMSVGFVVRVSTIRLLCV